MQKVPVVSIQRLTTKGLGGDHQSSMG